VVSDCFLILSQDIQAATGFAFDLLMTSAANISIKVSNIRSNITCEITKITSVSKATNAEAITAVGHFFSQSVRTGTHHSHNPSHQRVCCMQSPGASPISGSPAPHSRDSANSSFIASPSLFHRRYQLGDAAIPANGMPFFGIDKRSKSPKNQPVLIRGIEDEEEFKMYVFCNSMVS
jgi:hypothetical protein